MTHMDAHHAEYAAAVAGMAETYGTQQTPAVGDFVSGITAGRRWSGHVEWIDGDRLTINVGGGWLAVPLKDITH
jgi:hypothetical protein